MLGENYTRGLMAYQMYCNRVVSDDLRPPWPRRRWLMCRGLKFSINSELSHSDIAVDHKTSSQSSLQSSSKNSKVPDVPTGTRIVACWTTACSPIADKVRTTWHVRRGTYDEGRTTRHVRQGTYDEARTTRHVRRGTYDEGRTTKLKW